MMKTTKTPLAIKLSREIDAIGWFRANKERMGSGFAQYITAVEYGQLAL
jgi:hypothetical protein